MRICDFKIFNYRIPLVRPLLIGGKNIIEREGFIIRLADENGNAGFGEIAPLAGLSIEMPQVIIEQLKSLRNRLNGQFVPDYIRENGNKFSKWLENMPLAPCVHFGLETAVLSLKAVRLKKPLANLLDDNAQETLPINALLQATQETMLQEAKTLLACGYQTFKLKVGNGVNKLADDIAMCNALTKLIAGRAIVRLDANKSWTLQQACEFSKAIDFGAIEYIEEPLKDFSKVGEFYEKTLIPVAIDESLKEYSLRQIKSIDGVESVILKPTLLGGFEKIGQMVQEAHDYGLRTVLTSTFESGVGLRALVNLAACYSKHIAVGLDTAKWFAVDTILPPLRPERGRLQIAQYQFSDLQLNPQVVHEIA